MPQAPNAIAALLLSLSILRLSADGVDGACQMSTCRAMDDQEEEADTHQEFDIAMHMQTRVMRHDIPMPASDVPVASKTHDTPMPATTNANPKPSPGQDDYLDKAQAITEAESILREGLREAVSDLRGEWQQRLDQLKEREQKAERRQEAFGPMLEFRGIGSAPPALVVEAKKSQALGKDFMQLSALSDPAASIYVIAAVLGIIFVLFLVRKLYILEFRESKSQVAAFLEAETNASAKLQHLLDAMGFESTFDADAPIVQETTSNKSIEHAAASEPEPEAECSVETTVKAWFNKIENKIATGNVGEQASTPAVVAETPSPVAAADEQHLPEDSPA
jgi:hypothetical protein